jgi:hypothetical protein
MGEPERRLTRAEEDIIIAQKQRDSDANLRANTAGPQPPPEAVNAGAALGSPFGGAGYKIDPEALTKLIDRFESIRDRSEAQGIKLADAARSVKPPSLDDPAVGQANTARDSVLTAAEENKAIATYARGLIDALRKANGTYVQREDDTLQVLNAAQGDSNPLFRK